ncbi:hypothetical protein QTP88_026758 [Uroleucon formosanum]
MIALSSAKYRLRPLKSKTAEEVALTLLLIFLTFGAPNILHSNSGREFSNKIIVDLCSRWEGVKIVHGKPRHSQCQGSIERANQGLQNILRAMMLDKNTTKWSEALPFVQFSKNTAYHEGIKQTLYEAMFGNVAKRGLATSSLPREQIKDIETEEQFEQIIQSIGDSTISPHAVQDNDPPAPPIYIKNIANYSAFNSTLTSITGPNALTCKSSASHLIVQPSGRNSFNKIVSHLNETDASFHSFSPHFRRPYRVVIRNLHPSTLDTDISSSLDELGHQIKHIYNAKDKNKRPLPLFFVEIYSDEKNEDIHNIKSLLNTKVVIEKPHKKSYSRPQCHNCQEFGHTQNYCNHASRCVKCGAEHHTNECTKNPISPAKCALSSGDHIANFSGCPVFKRAQKKIKKPSKSLPAKVPVSNHLSSPKSYAEATRIQDSSSDHISVILSNFITNLNSLITPLITLLSSVLNALIPIASLSP